MTAAAAHDRDMTAGADRLLLAGKRVERVRGPGCECCKDADEALARHPIEELRRHLQAPEPVELSLSGLAKKIARVRDPIAQAEAIALAVEDRGLRDTAGLVPAFREAVKQAARGKGTAADGDDAEAARTGQPVEDVVPWGEPIDDPAALLDDVVALLQRYLLVPAAAAHAVALWAVFTHGLDLFWTNPRLALMSPVKRCGKTTTVELLAGLVARPKPSSGVTAAVVFRMIERWRPTYLIDEADGYLPENEELRSVLNSGHTRTSAVIDRNVTNADGDWEPRSFSTWCPLVVAGIGNLPGTLADRSIKIRLQRKPRAVKLTRFRADRVAGISELGRKLARFVIDNQIAIGEADIEPPEELHDRAADNWRPLLAIAHVVGGPWPERAEQAARILEKVDSDADDLCIQLLEDVRACFAADPSARRIIMAGDAEAAKEVRLFTSQIMQFLLGQTERPWGECNRGRALSQRGLAVLLKSFGVVTCKNVRRGQKQAKGFAASEFLEAWASYLPPYHLEILASQRPSRQKPSIPWRPKKRPSRARKASQPPARRPHLHPGRMGRMLGRMLGRILGRFQTARTPQKPPLGTLGRQNLKKNPP